MQDENHELTEFLGLLTVEHLVQALQQLDQKRAIWVDGGEMRAIFQHPDGDYSFMPDGVQNDLETETLQQLNQWLRLERIVEEPQ